MSWSLFMMTPSNESCPDLVLSKRELRKAGSPMLPRRGVQAEVMCLECSPTRCEVSGRCPLPPWPFSLSLGRRC